MRQARPLTPLQQTVAGVLTSRFETTTDIARAATLKTGMALSVPAVNGALDALRKKGIAEHKDTIDRVGSGLTRNAARIRKVSAWRKREGL